MLAIDVAQVLIVSQGTQQANGLSRLIVTALLNTLNQRHEVLEARLMLGWEHKRLLIAKVQERPPTSIRAYCVEDRGWQAVRGLAGAHKIVPRGNVGDGAKVRVLVSTHNGREDLIPLARTRPLALAQVILVDALPIN